MKLMSIVSKMLKMFFTIYFTIIPIISRVVCQNRTHQLFQSLAKGGANSQYLAIRGRALKWLLIVILSCRSFRDADCSKIQRRIPSMLSETRFSDSIMEIVIIF